MPQSVVTLTGPLDSPGQEFSHVLLTHASKHLEFLQVADVRFLIFAIGNA